MPAENIVAIALILAYFGSFMGVLAYAQFAESRPKAQKRPRTFELTSVRVGHHLPATAEPGSPLPLVAMKHVEVDAAAHAVR